MTVRKATSAEEFSELCKKAFTVAHFSAAWAPQCKQMDEVMAELAKEPQMKNVNFVTLEAEDIPELSMKHEITAVPTFILFASGKAVDRVDGAKAAELTKKVKIQVELVELMPVPPPAQKEDLNSRLKKLTHLAPCMVFIKGTPDQPKCGFSRQLVDIFQNHNIQYSSFNILEDEEVRQGLKTFSGWPTYPQVYVNGDLVGGLDIIKEMESSGELTSTLPVKKSQDDLNAQLKELTNSAPVMVFMKGSPDQPRCGFSRQLIDIINATGVKYSTFDILSDEEVRQGLKKYADFPTYPQLWVKGELVGGLDIVKELVESGELESMLKA